MAVINTNVKALFSQNALTNSGKAQSLAMQQLSTGKRINSARDDAAGMAIATRMTHQIRSLNQAVRNAGDAITLIQTAEGATNEITDMMQRMRELAVQAVNDTNDNAQRMVSQVQVAQSWITPYGAVTPKLTLNARSYQFDQALASTGVRNASVVVPGYSLDAGAGRVGGLKVIDPLGADQGIGPAQLHVSQHEQIQIRASRQMVRLDEQGLARPVLGGQQQGQQAAGLERRRTRHGLGQRRLRQSHTHAQPSQHGP